ncbi:hypothetical protein F4813DRAFT_101987 [Daldinia decipiens]|uniref:uncharacterized protein n=1 Tax=Daldinia decipiens TaxID=326647 RepID=UPI0020C4EB09|nr:uncharacterized protein F4813DRAFT_101987 [Daldinia decipiens]KAI1662200.1 hypothetical protein F4813DRAFT_101987 [Daldinia decipiens]
MHALALALFVAPAVMAATPRARSGLPKSFAQSKLLNVFATCDVGRVQCENGCMPIDGVCCNDNSDEYCRNGYYCIPNACCPEGEMCSGSSDDEASCDIGETECGDLCMPLTGTCCADGLHYCPEFGTCTNDGYCCEAGDDCDDNSSSFPSFTSSFLGSSSSSATDDDFTSTTSRTTTATATFTIHHESSSSTSSKTSSDTSSEETSSSSATTVDSTTQAPVTPAPTAVVTTTVSHQAGGIFTADGKIAAGLAVVAALLV